MGNRPAKVQVFQGALIGALFLGFVGFNVGFVTGGPGDTTEDHGTDDPPPANYSFQREIQYRWQLPIAALGWLGEALLGAVLGGGVVALARRWSGQRGGTIAVILLGGLGGVLLGISVGGYVAAERVVVLTVPSPGHVKITTMASPNVVATLVTAVLGAVIGSLAGAAVSQLFGGYQSSMLEPVAKTAEPLEALPRA
jgi:hypothetical protein